MGSILHESRFFSEFNRKVTKLLLVVRRKFSTKFTQKQSNALVWPSWLNIKICSRLGAIPWPLDFKSDIKATNWIYFCYVIATFGQKSMRFSIKLTYFFLEKFLCFVILGRDRPIGLIRCEGLWKTHFLENFWAGVKIWDRMVQPKSKKRRGFGRTFFNLSYLSNSISKSYSQNLTPTLAGGLCEDHRP